MYPDDVETILSDVRGIKELSVVGLPDPAGGEKVGLLAVTDTGAADEPASERSARRERAMKALREAFERLPRVARPSVVHFVDADLPRTATRKVKRSEVRRLLERLAAATASTSNGEAGGSEVRAILANLTGRALKDILPSSNLRGDLGVVSLLSVELASALESSVGSPIDGRELSRCETVSDLEAVVRRGARAAAIQIEDVQSDGRDDEPIRVPEPFAEATKRALTAVQMGFYDRVMSPTVYGRA